MTDAPTPRRRWYQFRLSTVLVLVAICAWAMAYWPWGVWEVSATNSDPNVPGLVFRVSLDHGFSGHIGLCRRAPEYSYAVYWGEIPYQLLLPTITLIAFLAWKQIWPHVIKWKRQPDDLRSADIHISGTPERKPVRQRWHQFRLSTALVLVAIIAWAMTYWPWGQLGLRAHQGPNVPGVAVGIWLDGVFSWQIGLYQRAPRFTYELYAESIPCQLALPALALFAFLAWKWTRPRVARWRAGHLESLPRT